MSNHLYKLALSIATEKHAAQVDKGGNPYIEHPIRVSGCLVTPQEKILGLLHDVVEDTDCTYAELLAQGFPQEIITALECLTKRPNEGKIEAAHRAASNRLACAVKIADVMDNMDIWRIPNPTEKDFKRLEKYREVLLVLIQAKAEKWDNFSDREYP